MAEAVEAITDQLGYDPEASPDADEEVTRQSDLGRMRSLATEFERAGGGDAAAFGAELARRFSTEHSGRGVNLLTYHRAKGLEFDAVFLPRLLDGELPFRSGRAKADPEEERRLLYVGITRARRYLFLTWPAAGRAQPSPFLDEMELAPSVPSRPKAAPGAAVTVGRGGALFDRLKEWRRKRAHADGVPAYVVFHDRTLAEIAERRCKDWADLAAISGVGPAKLERYADEVAGGRVALAARTAPGKVRRDIPTTTSRPSRQMPESRKNIRSSASPTKVWGPIARVSGHHLETGETWPGPRSESPRAGGCRAR